MKLYTPCVSLITYLYYQPTCAHQFNVYGCSYFRDTCRCNSHHLQWVCSHMYHLKLSCCLVHKCVQQDGGCLEQNGCVLTVHSDTPTSQGPLYVQPQYRKENIPHEQTFMLYLYNIDVYNSSVFYL